MNANAFRHFYDYHFSENRKIWEQYVMPLSQEAFVRDSSYSRGSVRNQIMHIMDVDDSWFSELRGIEIPYAPNPEDMDNRRPQGRLDLSSRENGSGCKPESGSHLSVGRLKNTGYQC